jgi:amino acid permease
MTKETLAKRNLIVILLNLILLLTRLIPFLEQQNWLLLLVLPSILATPIVQFRFWRKYKPIYEEIRKTKYRLTIGPTNVRIAMALFSFGFLVARFLTFDNLGYDLFLNIYGTIVIGLLIFALAAVAWRDDKS